MYKSDVLKFYGTIRAVCDALKISPVAFTNWGEVIPEARAYEVQVKTKNKLKFDAKLYEDKKASKTKNFYLPVKERGGDHSKYRYVPVGERKDALQEG